MDRGQRTLGFRLATLALGVAVLAGACSSGPVSQTTESIGPASTPATDPSSEPAPTDAPPTDGPTDAPPTGAPAGIPDKPGDVTFEEVDREPAGQGTEKVTYRISWTAPEGVATSFTLVGVTECLRNQEKFNGKPCLVRGMRIPKDAQQKIKSVEGDKRSTQLSWKVGEIGLPPYSAVLIRASNDAGDSIFTIAWSDTVCYACTY